MCPRYRDLYKGEHDISSNRTSEYIPEYINLYQGFSMCKDELWFSLNNTSKTRVIRNGQWTSFMINTRVWNRDLRSNYFSNWVRWTAVWRGRSDPNHRHSWVDPQCNNNKDEGKAENMYPTDKILEQACLNGRFGGGDFHPFIISLLSYSYYNWILIFLMLTYYYYIILCTLTYRRGGRQTNIQTDRVITYWPRKIA